MAKDLKALTYIVDDNMIDTISWLLMHQDCYDRFEYDAFEKTLWVHHANGTDQIKVGQYLNASYGLLVTS